MARVAALQLVRHVVQIVVLVALNARIFGVAPSPVIVPFLHPTGAPYSVAHGVYESIEYPLSHGQFPFLAIGVLLLTGVTIGKVLCGWACPFGLVQDIAAYIPLKRVRLSRNMTTTLHSIKWGVVGFSLLCCALAGTRRAALIAHAAEQGSPAPKEWQPIGALSDSAFSAFSPSATLFAYLPWMALWNPAAIVSAGLIAWVKLALLIGFLVGAALIPRFFCRFVCPVGALLEPFATFKMLRIRRSAKMRRDEFNRLMDDTCPVGVEQLANEPDAAFIAHPSCIHCGRCLASSSLLSQELSF